MRRRPTIATRTDTRCPDPPLCRAGELPSACVCDKGQERSWLQGFLDDADQRAAAKGSPISYSFGAVSDFYGLQAADTIATEHYWQSLRFLDTGEPISDPHFKSLMKQTNPVGYVLHEADIRALREDYLRAKPLREHFGKRRRPSAV